MNEKYFSQKITLKVVVFLTLLFSIYLVYFSQTREIFNYQSNQRMFDLADNISSLESKKINKLVDQTISKGDAQGLYPSFEELYQKMQLIDDYFKSENFSAVDKAYSQMQVEFKKLVTSPDVNQALVVLHGKSANFHRYVKSNSWPTLTRISYRNENLVTPYKVQAKNFYSGRRLKNILSVFESNLNKMEKLTEKSLLKDFEKKQISKKIDQLRVEVKLISNYQKSLDDFEKSKKTFITAYDLWFEDLRLDIIDVKNSLIKSTNTFYYLLICFVIFQVLAFAIAFYLSAKTREKRVKAKEKDFLSLAKDLVFASPNFLEAFSSESREQASKLSQSISTRMSFGQVFQEALPFSALMLDDNLNLVWANKLFYELWDIENDNAKHTGFTWDQLQLKTNLGENDPILEAHKNKVAGIYQIQVKLEQEKIAQPFEMYVSPIDLHNQSKIMIFFYPLKSLEDSLQQQSRSIIGPIKRTLEALTEGNFNKSLLEKLRKDFEIGNILYIYELFQKYHHSLNNKLNSLLEEINQLEQINIDYKQRETLLSEVLTENKKTIKTLKKLLVNDKQRLLASCELKDSLRNQLSHLEKKMELSFKNQSHLLEKLNVYDSSYKADLKSIEQIQDKKSILLNEINLLESYRSELLSSFNQVYLNLKKSNATADESGLIALGSFKEKILELSDIYKLILKKFRDFDIGFSKLDMTTQSRKVQSSDLSLDDIKDLIHQSRNELSHDMTKLNSLTLNLDNLSEDDSAELVLRAKLIEKSYTTNQNNLPLS